MNLTPEQEAAVRARNRNILVAAAAGSGKTSVLTERIFTLVAEEGVDIDRLLVVTFTRAAAAEMRERIRKRFADYLAAHPGDAHIRRQETLLHHAQITTIDSFCQYVVRENITELEVDPAYRVADTGEMALLSQEALDETLETLYEEKDPAFLRLASYFGTQPSDAQLEKHILALSRKADSMPYPVLWLTQQKTGTAGADGFEDSAAVLFCKNETAALLENCVQRIRDALAICEQPDGPYPYADRLEKDLDMLERVCESARKGTFDDLRSSMLNLFFDDIGRVSQKDAVNPGKKELVRAIRANVKDTVAGLVKRFFRLDAAGNIRMEDRQHTVVCALVDAVMRYRDVFFAHKKEKNLFAFDDVAHFALDILTTAQIAPDGSLQSSPTRIAREMADYYREVMIDEYQDSNLIQEVLFEAVAGREDGRCTRFMVGDVKQSIYRFRLARPELFMKKLDEYRTEEDAEQRKILLHHNFRSRPEVLDSVNALFARLMHRDLGGIEYDADARLYAGRQDAGTADDRKKTELLLCESATEKEAFEASVVAERIRRLVREDGFSYRDIVILLRAPTGRDETWRRVLEAEGIPVYVESRTGYFNAREVVVMLQMLSVLNNPLDDTALVAVMHSPIGMFTEEETATLRVMADRMEARGYFYEVLQTVAQHAEGGELAAKLRRFLDMIEDFRNRSGRMPLQRLIGAIADETGFANALSAQPDGERRSANLQLLQNRAAGFELSGMRGLSRFVHFIGSLQKVAADEGEANVLDENADVVRLMSIHKSKGLEFPVVFLAGCAKGFLRADSQGDLLLDEEYGIGIPWIDTEKRTKQSALKRNVIARKAMTEMLGEELRVLYVATTRAKEKLVISGTLRDPEKEKSAVSALRETGEAMSYAARAGANSYLRWILTALVSDDAAKVFSVTGVSGADRRAEEAIELIDAANRYEKLPAEQETPEGKRVKAMLEARFNWQYRHEALKDLFAKTTVTELKAQLAEEAEHTYQPFSFAEEAATLPSFMRDKADPSATVHGAERGTLYHKAMELLFSRAVTKEAQLLPLTAGEDALRAFYERMEQEGYLPAGATGVIRMPDLTAFLSTPLAVRMERAAKRGMLYTERPFMMGVPADTLSESLPGEELLLIQGIIDCYFEEDDGLVVLDYKTDRVKSGEELVRRYAAQLDYYAKALHTITGKAVKECLVYSFHLPAVVTLPREA